MTTALEALARLREGNRRFVDGKGGSHQVRANVRASANHLRHGSGILEQMIQDGQILIIGVEYSLETGVVDFFDGVPEGA